MQPERWQRLQKIYFKALKLPLGERPSFLDEACPDDAEMRAEVESLLRCETKIEQFLEPPAINALADISDAGGGFAGLANRDSDPYDFIGRVVDDRYVITEIIGSGGMGDVYRADHRLLGTPVAIKRLGERFRKREEYLQRAIEEARRSTLLDHENIAKVKDVVEEGDEVLVVMEFIDGNTLKAHLDQPMGLDEFLDISLQCASALAAAHEQRIVHLDIKPENIMLTASRRVKICDFGLAHQLPSGAGEEETRWRYGGTPAYMAPEVLDCNPFDVRADIFSLGLVFYEMLAGRHPFRSSDVRATANRILNEAAPPLRGVKDKLPDRLIRLVAAMLAKDPGVRLTAAETLRELRVIRHRRMFLKDIWRATEGWIPVKLKRRAALLTLAALLLTLGGLTYFAPRPLRSGPLSIFGFSPWTARNYVAVLPFRVIGERSERGLYAEGIYVLLANRLSQLTGVPDLDVVPPNAIRERNIDTVEKARSELGATIVIDGMFEFSGDQAVVTYSLINTADGQTLGFSSLRTTPENNFDFQQEVIREVAARLEQELAPGPGSGTRWQQARKLYNEGLAALVDYHVSENLETAIRCFRRALQVDPNYAAAHAALGRAYWLEFKDDRDPALLDQSQAACEKARTLDEDFSDAHVCLGRIFQERGDHKLAIEYYERAIDYSAANDDAFRSLASVLEEGNRFREAEREYHWAAKLRPQYWENHRAIADFYNARHDYTRAIDYYNTARSLSNGNARIQYSIGNTYVNLGRYDMAIQALQEAVALRPNSARPHFGLGLAYLKWRNYRLALQELETAAQLAQDYRITGNLARIYRLTGQRDKARETFELAIEQAREELRTNNRSHVVHMYLGRYYAMIGKKADAMGHIDEALRLHPGDPGYVLAAATANASLGQRKEALSLIEQAVHLGFSAVQIKAEPELDVLQNEPRYVALTAKG